MSTPQPPDSDPPQSGGRTLIMVHGGSHKPDAETLATLWHDAIAAGLDRDYEKAGGRALLTGTRLELAYYGDLSNRAIADAGQAPDPDLDLVDRRRDLERLAALSGKKKFRRVHYEAVPGKNAGRELFADLAAPLLATLRVSDSVLRRRLPSLVQYLKQEDLREAIEARLLDGLAPALARGDDVMLLSHGLGSVISYDALWRLSYDPDWAPAGRQRVRRWVTVGSPLASEYVKRRLRGASEQAPRCFPDRLITWFNVAAEDDYLCHDKTVANDFAAMLHHQRLSRIHDYRIYNLAIRYGRSNPHNGVGYLVHPRLTRLLADWLTNQPES